MTEVLASRFSEFFIYHLRNDEYKKLEVITGIATTRIPNLFKDMYELRLLYSLDCAHVPENLHYALVLLYFVKIEIELMLPFIVRLYARSPVTPGDICRLQDEATALK